MGGQGLLLLIGLKLLIIMTSLQNIVILCAKRSPDVDGIKIFDQDDQAAKHYSFNVLRPGHPDQKF